MKELKRLTNKGQRYSIAEEGMGCFGDPDYYPTHTYSIFSGNYFYCSIDSFLKEEHYPEDAKKKVIDFLKEKGYNKYLEEKGII